jgi:hypothetical protein
MMRAKKRGRWEIAANHNVRLPGALTGKRRRETSLDSKAAISVVGPAQLVDNYSDNFLGY